MKKIFTYLTLLLLTSAFAQNNLSKDCPPKLITPVPSVNNVVSLIGPILNNVRNNDLNENENDDDDDNNNRTQINKQTQDRTNQTKTNTNEDRENDNDNDGDDDDRDDLLNKSVHITTLLESLNAIAFSISENCSGNITSAFNFNSDQSAWRVKAGYTSIF